MFVNSGITILAWCACLYLAYSTSIRRDASETGNSLVDSQHNQTWLHRLEKEPRETGAQPGPVVLGKKQNGPILIYQKPSKEQLDAKAQVPRRDNSPVRIRSAVDGAGGPGMARKEGGKSDGFGLLRGLSSAGYFIIVVVIGFAILVFVLALYIQQRDDVPPEESNSQPGEAKQVLKNRLYVVKRYIPYHFDAGLPCPEKHVAGSSSSGASFTPIGGPTESKATKSLVKGLPVGQ